MTNALKLLLGFLALAGLTVSLTLAYALGAFAKKANGNGHANGHRHAPAGGDDEDDGEETILLVKAVNPRLDPNFVISIEQLCTVEPFFEAELRSRVPGTVKYVQKDLGSRVSKGEIVVDLDVPDLAQEVLQKESVISQRQQEYRVAQTGVKNAEALAEVARVSITYMKTEVTRAEAKRDVRQSRLTRVAELRQNDVVYKSLVDEYERDYREAVAEYDAAKIAVRKAELELEEKLSSLEHARADVLLKQTATEVARKDRDRALAMAELARLRAPFDGVITERKVDVGHFVPNAASGQSEPLVTIARSDVVTVSMKVPDNAAPFVRTNTEALVQIKDLPGVLVRGRVTRFSPSVGGRDRTMRVEVDFFNGPEKEYRQYKSRIVAASLAALGHTEPCAAAGLLCAGRDVWGQNVKSVSDPFPLLPEGLTKRSLDDRFLPGMTGYMRLNLNHFQDAYLLPSSAVFSRGGRPYILLVRDGVSHLTPVRVQMNDGRLAKVALVLKEADAAHGEPELLQDLTGDEVVVLSRQVEIGDGQRVNVNVEPW